MYMSMLPKGPLFNPSEKFLTKYTGFAVSIREIKKSLAK